MVAKLVRCEMARESRSCRLTLAPLLVAKTGPPKFPFTVDLQPTNRYTIKHKFSTPIIEQEIQKLSNSTMFASFDLNSG